MAATPAAPVANGGVSGGAMSDAQSDTHPPIVRSLAALYAAPHAQVARYASLRATFTARYGAAPDFYVRAPGRVNLIGEHVDYNGFGVLPIAIENDTLLAVRLGKPANADADRHSDPYGEVQVASAVPKRYGEATFSVRDVTDLDGALVARPPPPRSEADGGAESFGEVLSPTSRQPRRLSHPSLFHVESLPARSGGGAGSSSSLGARDSDDESEDNDAAGLWTRYVQAGCKGVWQAEKQRLRLYHAVPSGAGDGLVAEVDPLRFLRFPAMQVLVDSTVPPAAGLSSSSSLVCAAALLSCYALRRVSPLDGSRPPFDLRASSLDAYSKLALAEIAANAERYVGTAGGGMDQAACFLGTKGSALRIEFSPSLSCSPVKLPANALLLVAHSLQDSRKAEQADTHFNRRVLECTLAAHVLAKTWALGPYAGQAVQASPSSAVKPASERTRSRRKTGGTAGASAGASGPPPPDMAALTLHDVLRLSGKTLVQMVQCLQAALDDEAGDNDPDARTTPHADAAQLPPPLHAHAYTLPELHSFFGLSSLRPLVAFRPALVHALREESYARSVRLAARERQEREAKEHDKPRVRTVFGRTVTTAKDRRDEAERKAEEAAAAAADADGDAPAPVITPLSLLQPLVPLDQMFPWELDADASGLSPFELTAVRSDRDSDAAGAGAKDAAPLSPRSKSARLPRAAPTGLTPKSAIAAAADVPRRTPYRAQGDPSLYTPEHTSLRLSAKRNPLIAKSLNRFWSLLPHLPSGDLSKQEYVHFFLRLCKLLNPDLPFADAHALVMADWERDVRRTRDAKKNAGAANASQLAVHTADVLLGNNTPAAAGAAGASAGALAAASAYAATAASSAALSPRQARREERLVSETTSIPYLTFFNSLFELVDLWVPDSNPNSYVSLLDQLFARLTVRVESRNAAGGASSAKRVASLTGRVDKSEQPPPSFALLQRALHVYSEALRTQAFSELCAREAAAAATFAQLAKPTSQQAAFRLAESSAIVESLGELLSASHVSLSRRYECSTREVDALVNTCVQHAGAVGARLTGAGWGGCVVALFDTNTFLRPEKPKKLGSMLSPLARMRALASETQSPLSALGNMLAPLNVQEANATDTAPTSPMHSPRSGPSLSPGIMLRRTGSLAGGAPAPPEPPAHSASVDLLLDAIVREYYCNTLHITDREPHRDNFKDCMFVTQPSAGAAIYIP